MEPREIYKCPVTGRYYDPLRVRRALLAVADWDDDEALTAVARSALGLAPIDPETGAGWLDAEAYAALSHFTDWLEKKDVTAKNWPTSAPSTACPPASTTTSTSN